MINSTHIDIAAERLWSVIDEKARTDKQFKDNLSAVIDLSRIIGNDFLEGYLQAAYNS